MGDRISIQFKNGNDISIAFFSHWDGKEMVNAVIEYTSKIKKEELADAIKDNNRVMYPFNRMEPNTIMLDFIRWFFEYIKMDRVKSNYYLGKDEDDGDNSDNGNWVYDLDEGRFLI